MILIHCFALIIWWLGLTIITTIRNINYQFNPLNAELNVMCYLLALLGVRRILHFSTVRVKSKWNCLLDFILPRSINWNLLVMGKLHSLFKKKEYGGHFGASRCFSSATGDYPPTSHRYSPFMANNGFYLVRFVSTDWSVAILL